MNLCLEFKIVAYNNINILNCIMLAGGQEVEQEGKEGQNMRHI